MELDKKHTDKYDVEFLKKINQKIQEIRCANKVKNILINGFWGAGKSHFIENRLSKTTSLVCMSCTDYADTHELITDLIEKTNNCLFRWLIRLSITRIIAILGKFELRQFIGINKVIVFDEFERLADYNKIDLMHIVSLIQYLNNQKNCICILVANDEPLNNTSQFTNVREKLISYIYHYKVPFYEVITTIQDEYLQDVKKHLKEKLEIDLDVKNTMNDIKTIEGYNQKVQELNDRIVTQESEKIDEIIDLNDSSFDNLKQHFQNRYQIDNNIRMVKHLYVKTNQIYATHKNFTDFEKILSIKRDEFFVLLFNNVVDLINPLYYLYLKNPYNLKAIETLAIVYTEMVVQSRTEKGNLEYYRDTDSIHNLALKILKHKNGNNELCDVSYDLNYIITNQNFEHIDAKLIKYFLGNEEIVIQLIFHNKEYGYGKTFNQNIKIFMRLFKETFCEDDDQKLINNYFSSINVLEQRFSRLIDDIELPWDYSIVIDYIAYCQYVDETYPRGNPKNIRPVSYNRITYINALIIQSINDSTIDNFKLIIAELTEYMKKNQNPSDHEQNVISLISELTCTVVVAKSKCVDFVTLIKKIINELAKTQEHSGMLSELMYQSYLELKAASLPNNEFNYDDPIKFIDLIKLMVDNLTEEKFNAIRSLEFMYQSYDEIKHSLKLENIERCNENLINLLTTNRNTKEFRSQLFMHLSNLNDGGTLVQNFNEHSLPILVNKIKEIFNTNELKQKFIETYKNHAWDIPKQVAEILQAELDAAAEPSNPKENPDDKQ